MNTNNAPERTDLYAGTYFAKEIPQKNDLSIWAVGCDGDSHVADFTGSNARRMAEEYRDWKNTMQPQVSESDWDDAYKQGFNDGFGEAKHRQPAAVSADAVRMRKALKLAKTDLLVCAGDPFVASAIKTIDAAMSPETVCKGE